MKSNEDFEDWYLREGVRFYTGAGHKEYMRFAYMAGRSEEANKSLTRPRKMPEPFYQTCKNVSYNWKH